MHLSGIGQTQAVPVHHPESHQIELASHACAPSGNPPDWTGKSCLLTIRNPTGLAWQVMPAHHLESHRIKLAGHACSPIGTPVEWKQPRSGHACSPIGTPVEWNQPRSGHACSPTGTPVEWNRPRSDDRNQLPNFRGCIVAIKRPVSKWLSGFFPCRKKLLK